MRNRLGRVKIVILRKLFCEEKNGGGNGDKRGFFQFERNIYCQEKFDRENEMMQRREENCWSSIFRQTGMEVT